MCAGMVLKHSGFVYACARGVMCCGRRVKRVMQESVSFLVVHVTLKIFNNFLAKILFNE